MKISLRPMGDRNSYGCKAVWDQTPRGISIASTSGNLEVTDDIFCILGHLKIF